MSHGLQVSGIVAVVLTVCFSAVLARSEADPATRPMAGDDEAAAAVVVRTYNAGELLQSVPDYPQTTA